MQHSGMRALTHLIRCVLSVLALKRTRELQFNYVTCKLAKLVPHFALGVIRVCVIKCDGELLDQIKRRRQKVPSVISHKRKQLKNNSVIDFVLFTHYDVIHSILTYSIISPLGACSGNCYRKYRISQSYGSG